MKFHWKAIFGTLIFIVVYMFIMNFGNPNPVGSHRWVKDLEISFSSITSIGALFWALYSVWKYQSWVNFQSVITGVLDQIGIFAKNIKKFNKLFKKLPPEFLTIFLPEHPEENQINNNQKVDKIINKYYPEIKKSQRDRAYLKR